MATLTRERPKANRKPRTPQPVRGNARWVGGVPSQAALANGDAILQITVEGQPATFYFVTENRSGRWGGEKVDCDFSNDPQEMVTRTRRPTPQSFAG
jgi:hypothetical protein